LGTEEPNCSAGFGIAIGYFVPLDAYVAFDPGQGPNMGGVKFLESSPAILDSSGVGMCSVKGFDGRQAVCVDGNLLWGVGFG